MLIKPFPTCSHSLFQLLTSERKNTWDTEYILKRLGSLFRKSAGRLIFAWLTHCSQLASMQGRLCSDGATRLAAAWAAAASSPVLSSSTLVPPHPVWRRVGATRGATLQSGPWTPTRPLQAAATHRLTWARSGLLRISGEAEKVWYQFDWPVPGAAGLRKLSVAWFKIRRAELARRRD